MTVDDPLQVLDSLGPADRARIMGDLWDLLDLDALPILARKAREWPVRERVDLLALAADLVGGSNRPPTEADPHAVYAAELAGLRELTEEVLRQNPPADDSAYADLLGALLAFEGVAVWNEQLSNGVSNEEFELPCPHCEGENFVVFGAEGRFSTIEPLYTTITDGKRLPLRPADPAGMDELPRRLHARALADGRPGIADAVTCMFGEAECVECGEVFRVDEAVVERWQQ